MGIREGYKKTEVGIVPHEWKCVRFGDFIESTRLGGNYANDTKQSEYPLIKMGNIGRGFINLNKIEYVKHTIPNVIDKLKYGDLLFNTRNTLELVGKVAIWRNELPIAYYNSNLMNFVFKKDIISTNFFVNYMFNTKLIINKLKDIATGTTSVAAIYNRDLFNIYFPIPPLKEQIAIAAALTDIDDLINSLLKLIDKKKNIKQGAMEALLTGTRRLPEFKGEWNIATLAELCTMITDGSHESPAEVNNGFFMPSVKDMNYNHFDFYDCKKISQIDYERLVRNGCRPQKNDVLISKDGSILKNVFVITKDEPIVILSSIAILRPNCLKTNSEYLAHYFRQPKFVEYVILNNKTGTGVPRIVLKNFKSIQIFLPDLDEQTAIADILSDMDKEIETLEQKLNKYKDVKQGMMQELLTGRIRLV